MSGGQFPVAEAYQPLDMRAFYAAGERVVEKYDRRSLGIYFSDEDDMSAYDDIRNFYQRFGLNTSVVAVQADRESVVTDWQGRYEWMGHTVEFIGELLLPELEIVEQRLPDRSVTVRPVVMFPIVGMLTNTRRDPEDCVLQGFVPIDGIRSIGRLQSICGYIQPEGHENRGWA